MAQEIFEDTEKAVEWMLKRNEYFFGKSPVDVCLTEPAGVLDHLSDKLKQKDSFQPRVVLSKEEQDALADLVKEIESDG